MIDTIINIFKMQIEFLKNPLYRDISFVIAMIVELIFLFHIVIILKMPDKEGEDLMDLKNERNKTLLILMGTLPYQVFYSMCIANSIDSKYILLLQAFLVLMIVVILLMSVCTIVVILLTSFYDKTIKKRSLLSCSVPIITILISIVILIPTLKYPIN